MAKQIRCADCRFVQVDKSYSTKHWTAYECGNHDSDYYGCLLNITSNGDKQKEITWRGCEEGRMHNDSD